MKTIQIRAVIFQEAAFWCAQCLEHNIAVQANSPAELISELKGMLAAYVELAIREQKVPFEGIPPAPSRYFEMFAKAHDFSNAPKVIEVDDAPTVVPEIRVLEPVAA